MTEVTLTEFHTSMVALTAALNRNSDVQEMRAKQLAEVSGSNPVAPTAPTATAPTTAEKPKVNRRTKAEIEAEKAASEQTAETETETEDPETTSTAEEANPYENDEAFRDAVAAFYGDKTDAEGWKTNLAIGKKTITPFVTEGEQVLAKNIPVAKRADAIAALEAVFAQADEPADDDI